MKKTDKVLSYLEDEQSKFIYQKRVEYCETGNFDALKAIVNRCLPGAKTYYPGIEEGMLKRIRDKKR